MKKNKAAFFDRDGTLIKDVSYLSDIKKIEILPGVIDFCLGLQEKGYLLFVVTNQSGVARGYFDEDFVRKTHDYLTKLFLSYGVLFEKFYYCPHLDQNCSCRKPEPGMLFNAAREFEIDLSRSLMFGDKPSDIQAGLAAGCRSFKIQDILKKINQES